MNPSTVFVATVLVVTCCIKLSAGEIEFNRDVRPILSRNCFACHGFDAKKRKADLRLDVSESALAIRDGTFAIKPGDPDLSEVWNRITSDDPEQMMPPPSSHKRLTNAERETIRRWIEQGAKYQKHWAFEPPLATEAPPVRNADCAHNPIDRFILARLDREGMQPQREADRETLIRRVALTLTGLPPVLPEIDEFLADKSPGAFERMVDHYLASPRYGEEMARYWLDVARYGDTHGLHLDNDRQMWAYRDWVVRAFNDNLPFDQFTVWQLAGDMLPHPTPAQLTATGFNRCNVTTGEGGTIEDEFRYRYAVERASTTIETWLGLTGGCAVCHDHKYDPIATREFYSFYAFFNNAADPPVDGNVNNTPPFFKLPSLDQQERLNAAQRREDAARRKLEAAAAQTQSVDPATATAGPTGADASCEPTTGPTSYVVFDDTFPFGSVVRNTTRNSSNWVVGPSFGAPSGRRVLKQSDPYFLEDDVQCPLRPVVVPPAARFEVWLRVDRQNIPTGAAIEVDAGGLKRQVWWGREEVREISLPRKFDRKWIGPLPEADQWTKLVLTPSDFDLKEGARITSIAVQQSGGTVWWDGFTIVGARAGSSDPLVSFARWWEGMGAKPPPDVPIELQKTLTGGPAKAQQPELRRKLEAFYLAYVAHPVNRRIAELRRDWETAREAYSIADYELTGTMIYRDLSKPRESFVMARGQYDKPAEKVEPGVPAILPALKKAQTAGRATRLDLAQWLVSSEQPLSARVQVNRLWQQVFGIGLVKTSEDFGSQGETPSHPELLDWLAVRYRDHGWNTKQLVRLLLTSATFRQRAYADPTARQRDPENRLLARGPRFRLDAEQIRDSALAVSGLVRLDMGGPGVKPYQPPNIWEPLGFHNSNTRYYVQDHGPALYRRSLYVYLKRTAPAPFLANFDAPSREQFCSRRERSDTPMQALQLMNDVQFFEAARALAERAIAEGGTTVESRVEYLYRTVLSRRPDAEEKQVLTQAYARQLASFQASPQDASMVVAHGESVPRRWAGDVKTAAWTMAASVILNLDETINRN